MRATHWAMVISVLGAVLATQAKADEGLRRGLRQPVSLYQTAYEDGAYFSYMSQEEAGESPSDEAAVVPEAGSGEEGGCSMACDSCCEESCGGCSRQCCACGLPQPCFLACRGITVGGWLEVGISAVSNEPADRFNGVVTFNDRDGEIQMNQLWFYLDREADTGGYGWDIGGHVDFVYGTDAMFTQASDGLEATWGQTERFYQVALPQFYFDLAYNDLTIRMGHFYTIIGYEVVQAPDNFFYSHAYTMQYGEPFTHTGMLFIYQLSDQLSVTAGFTRGWDNFDDTIGSDSLGFLGGVNWTSWSERVELAAALTASEEGVHDADNLMYSLVGTLHLADNLSYVIQHDYGQQVVPGVSMAEWYGLNQYLLYEINPYWSAGLRFEWFRDHDGTRVAGVRPSNVLNGESFPGNFYEFTAGLNWKPRENLVVRPEVRWDWYDASGAVAPLPYDSGDLDEQFMFGIDMILTY